MNITETFLQFALLGATWVLWLLIALSVISIYVIIERFAFYRSLVGADATIGRRLRNALSELDWSEAETVVKKGRGTGARMVHEMLAVRHGGKDAMEAAMTSVRSDEKIRLERNLSFLGTVGSNAPFIGLFGTVLGIIQAFNQLGATGRATGAQAASIMGGISEALVATAVGLLVAIPAVVAYNMYQRRVKQTLSEGDALANQALALITAGKGHD